MNEMKSRAEMNLDILVKNGGFQFTDTFFPYTSGEIGPYYVQSGVVQNNGDDYHKAVSSMVMMIESNVDVKNFDIVTGGESRDWIFSGQIATALKPRLGHTMLYKNGKQVGPKLKDKRVLHAADLNNEGSSPRDLWVPSIRESGGKVEHIFFYVDREESGVRVMKELGLESNAVVSLNGNAWDYLQKVEVVGSGEYKNLMARMEDKDAWARAMLRSDAGFAKFEELYGDQDTRAKALKVLDVGYPDMKEELLERLKA